MKRCAIGVSMLCALALIVSCASVQLVSRSDAAAPAYVDQLKGKTIAIVPFEVSFGASRFVIDLRGVTVTSGGKSFPLQTRYIAQDKDNRLGEIGVLDVDILTKAGTDKKAIQDSVTQIMKAGLGGAYDYHIGFFKGLGEGNMGELSNRAVDYDRSVYPPALKFTQDAPPGIYADIRVLPPRTAVADAGTDLVVTGDVSITSEVVEVLSGPTNVQSSDPSAHLPQPGDYYLTLRGTIHFTITDTKTGKVIASEKTPRDYPVMDIVASNILIPAKKSDAAAYATYFRSVDFNQITMTEIQNVLPSLFPLMTPFVVTTTHQVAAQK